MRPLSQFSNQPASDMTSDTLADNSVICLMAPTASGKTALAYELYDTGRYELISVDSALIYRDMNIGSAKPSAAELQRYPHHLVDIIDPTQSYSVAQFVSDTARLIDEIHARGRIPLLVGGTMMYYMALLDGLSSVPDSEDKVRAQVEQWRQSDGIEALYAHLGTVDPRTHARLKPTDTQRITRALEVYLQTKTPISTWQDEPKHALVHNPNQQWHALCVMPDRAWLHARIEQRLEMMWADGLVDEVLGLLAKYPLNPNMPAMRSVGYRQVLEYLVHTQHPIFELPYLDKPLFYDTFMKDTNLQHASSSIELMQALACQQMQNKALYATRQLAKRQYTWLRKVSKLTSPALSASFITMAQAGEYLR